MPSPEQMRGAPVGGGARPEQMGAAPVRVGGEDVIGDVDGVAIFSTYVTVVG